MAEGAKTKAVSSRFPPWIRKRIPASGEAAAVQRLLNELGLATVCSSAHCPNLPECFARGTATFLILGSTCTRGCRFCAIGKADPGPLRADEPEAVAEACVRLRLRHVVITSVTRDDLADGGAGHFARTVRAVRARLPGAIIEVLTPDFQGDRAAIDAVLGARPDIFNHNVETVPRLYPEVRPQADYRRSLEVLAYAASRGVSRRGEVTACSRTPLETAPLETAALETAPLETAPAEAAALETAALETAALETAPAEAAAGRVLYTKSGLMVGLGERPDEVREVLRDLRGAGCAIVTIGQYLAPSAAHAPVARFVPPEEFAAWEAEARALGFAAVASGPFVRSSYQAEQVFGGRRA